MISPMPRMIWGINGHVIDGTSTPIRRVRPPASPAAVMLGTNPCSSMIRRILLRVSASTSGFWLMTRETVVLETPASRAISLIVTVLAMKSLQTQSAAQQPCAQERRHAPGGVAGRSGAQNREDEEVRLRLRSRYRLRDRCRNRFRNRL